MIASVFVLEEPRNGLINSPRTRQGGLIEHPWLASHATSRCRLIDLNLATNPYFAPRAIHTQIKGDPHMVGLLGQKIDWYGEDNGWYCLVADPTFQINARVTAPMPEDFPTRQLVTGVSLVTANGHTLTVEVKDPYTTTTDGCSTSSPCLADGALRILVDGEESYELQAPGEGIALPGGVIVSAANLPAECRAFGGSRIWAAEYAALQGGKTATGRRSLLAQMPFVDWLLEADTIPAPRWCAKFVGDKGPDGMSQVQSNHAILRIETPAVTLRVNIGINFQDSVLGEDGEVRRPELEFWQTDLAFEGMMVVSDFGGMLGDTSRFVLGHDGMPITRGMGALHGPVEGYRLSGPLAVEFDLQH